MNQVYANGFSKNLPYPERRSNNRHQVLHILVVTNRGTGQVVDISKTGLSFGCLYPHVFPKEWSLDILDAKGSHLKRLPVRIIWQKQGTQIEQDTPFELLVGVEFTGLSPSQSQHLENLLEDYDILDFQYSTLI